MIGFAYRPYRSAPLPQRSNTLTTAFFRSRIDASGANPKS